jgi:hypothetical protein
VRAQNQACFYQAIDYIHSNNRRFIAIHTLAKALNWSLNFAKSMMMRLHNEKLVDMSEAPSYNGYKVLFSG